MSYEFVKCFGKDGEGENYIRDLGLTNLFDTKLHKYARVSVMRSIARKKMRD
jgi:hypothetical protein